MKIRKKILLKVFVLLILFQNSAPFILGGDENILIDYIFDFSNPSPKSSDISGNELYGEQILVQVAGNHSLIQQSYITNDTNIFEELDLSDPAFYGSSFMIQVSNGIKAKMDPSVYSSNNITKINTTYQSMSGFLFYNNQSNYDRIQMRKERAINIFKNIFEMDFILLNMIEDPYLGYYYPFFGFTPNWDSYFETTISNLPVDGYWGAFNPDTLSSDDYVKNHHLSSSMLFMKNFNYLDKYLVNFNDIDIPLDFDFSSLGGSSLLNPVSTSSSDSNFLGGLLGNGDIDQPEDENEEENEEFTYLENLENVLIYSVHYEGNEGGITEIGDQKYNFDLFKALNYTKPVLHVSEKIYNSFDGISLSTIGLGFFSAEVLESYPNHFQMDENYTNRIESMLFLVDQSIDLSSIKDYSFKIAWESNEVLSKLVTIPQNLKNESDFINLLSILGPSGMGMNIPSSFIKPLENLVCEYQLLEVEPSLYVKKIINTGNASRILEDNNNPDIEIFVENRGDQAIWGQEINLTALGISNDPTQEITLLDLNMDIFEIMGYDTERIIEITTTLGYDIDVLFHDNNPRFFNIDSNNTGTVDLFYPEFDLTAGNLEFLIPFSPSFSQLLIENSEAYGAIADNPQVFNSSASIFNPSNWKLDPGQNFSIQLSNTYSVTEDYIKFYNLSVADLGIFSPVISIGNILSESDISGTYFINDSNTWNIESEDMGNNHQIQQYLTFQNSSFIDLENNTLDSINLEMNFTKWDNDTTYNIEIFNYTQDTGGDDDGFVTILGNSLPQTPDSLNLTITSIEYNLSQFYDVSNNFSIILRITSENQNKFEINFDLIQLNFQDIKNDRIMMNPASVTYSTEIGSNQYTSHSNSISLGIDDGAHLMGISEVEHFQSYCGEILTYNLSISNLGNQKATNITIEIEQPGILYNLLNVSTYLNEENISIIKANAGNLTVKNGILYYEINEILPGQEVKNISFQFYTPNSRLIPKAIIEWRDHSYSNYSQDYYFAESNQIYLSAPIFYQTERDIPYKHDITIEFISDFSTNAPKVGDNFSVNAIITNLGKNSLYDIYIPTDQSSVGISLHNNSKNIWIEELQPFSSQIFQINFTKNNIMGYMIPQLNINSSSDKCSLIFQSCKEPLVLGSFNLTITKVFETIDTITNKEFNVKIIIENNGNLELGNFTIFDISYDAAGFVLTRGTLIKDVDFLDPGDHISFNYTLKTLNSKGIYKMAPAQIDYFYKYKYTIKNDPIDFKIRENYLILTSRMYIPLILGFSIIFLTKKYKTKYSREDAEFDRRDSLMFGKSLREVSWHKKNLNEFLEEQVEKLKKEDGFQ